jgi:hypothetical protein
MLRNRLFLTIVVSVLLVVMVLPGAGWGGAVAGTVPPVSLSGGGPGVDLPTGSNCTNSFVTVYDVPGDPPGNALRPLVKTNCDPLPTDVWYVYFNFDAALLAAWQSGLAQIYYYYKGSWHPCYHSFLNMNDGVGFGRGACMMPAGTTPATVGIFYSPPNGTE